MTGAYGCVGAWVVAQLVAEGVPVTAFDVGDDPGRLRLLLTDDELATVPRVRGDVADLDALEAAIDEHEITNLIHLAALQVPFCAADPRLGAVVNVVGTVNVFEAVRRRADRMAKVVYASSIAAYDANAGMTAPPSTLYGVYKRANEGTAAVYRADHGIASIGLRPHTVYGPGRDRGLTSAPTAALLAAAAGERYRIPFGGRCQLQYAPDVARAFVAASRSPYEGARVCNLRGTVAHMAQLVEAIEAVLPASAGSITFDEPGLPFPEALESTGLDEVVGPCPEMPLTEGVRDALQRFQDLMSRGLVARPEPVL